MSRENVEVIRRLFDAFNRRDTARAQELWVTDGEFRPAYTGGGLVEGAVYRGHEGLAEYIALQADTWESMVAIPVELRDLGNRVLVEVRLESVGRGSGVPLDGRTWNVFELHDGRVVDGRVYITKEDALEAVELRD